VGGDGSGEIFQGVGDLEPASLHHGQNPLHEKAALFAVATETFSAATPDDVKQLATDVLLHRIILTYEAEEMTVDAVMRRILDAMSLP
jgi:hypothetical protein